MQRDCCCKQEINIKHTITFCSYLCLFFKFLLHGPLLLYFCFWLKIWITTLSFFPSPHHTVCALSPHHIPHNLCVFYFFPPMLFHVQAQSLKSYYSAYMAFNWNPSITNEATPSRAAPMLDVFHRCHRQGPFIKLVKIAQSTGNVNFTGAKTMLIELVTMGSKPLYYIFSAFVMKMYASQAEAARWAHIRPIMQ